jgi:hypothetical protein
MHVYTPPAANTVAQFESLYGTELWVADEESYDYLVKVSSGVFIGFSVRVLVGGVLTGVDWIGRACAKSIRGAGCQGGDHWPTALAGWRPGVDSNHRSRFDWSGQGEPARVVVVQGDKGVHRCERGAVQRAARQRLPIGGRLALDQEGRRVGHVGERGG